MLIYIYCGVGLVVEYVLAKDETRVRFPYAAHTHTGVLGALKDLTNNYNSI